MLGEPIIAIEIISMIVCFTAVIVIAYSEADQSTEEFSDNSIDILNDSTFLGLMAALACAFMLAFTGVLVRSLKAI